MMYCAPSLLILQCFTLLLTTPVSVSQESTRYVGEELSLGCTRNGGGGPGRWYINEVYTNVTAARFVDTIEVVDGEFNYDGTLRCEGGDSYSMKTYGLFGVSPSPLNCSSTDHTTNTCTVSAPINSSLTLCADFTRYPSDAPRFADISEAHWANANNTWLWFCNPEECIANPAVSVNIIFTNQWGTCAQVESIQEDTSLSFSVVTFPPPNSGIGKNLHSQAGLFQKVNFNIQVERLPSSTSPSLSSSSTQVPHSTTSSQPRVTSTIRLTSAVSSTLPSMTSTLSESSPSTSQTAESSREAPSPTGSSHPPYIGPLSKGHPDATEAILPVVIILVVLALVIAVIGGLILFILCKTGRLKCNPEKYIKPSLQSKDTISPKDTVSRPCELLFKDGNIYAIESGMLSTSTLKPLLGSSNSDRNSMVTPDSDYHPDTCVTEENTHYTVARETSSPKGTPCTQCTPARLDPIEDDGEDLFSGGLGSIVEKV